MKKKRICKGCGVEVAWAEGFVRSPDYCDDCLSGSNPDKPIKAQSLYKRMPSGKYAVMACKVKGMVGRLLKKGTFVNSATDGSWPDGMMVFNIRSRTVFEIKGTDILIVLDPPDVVKKRINSTYPK